MTKFHEFRFVKNVAGVDVDFVCTAFEEDYGPSETLVGEILEIVLAEQEKGNWAAWFVIEVVAKIGNLSGDPVYLGGCSYYNRGSSDDDLLAGIVNEYGLDAQATLELKQALDMVLRRLSSASENSVWEPVA